MSRKAETLKRCKKCGRPIPPGDTAFAFVLRDGKVKKERRCMECATELGYKLLGFPLK